MTVAYYLKHDFGTTALLVTKLILLSTAAVLAFTTLALALLIFC